MKDAYLMLEDELAEWCGMRNVVVCSSGTAALHLALEAMECLNTVYMSDYNMIACPRAVTLSGQTPKFLDCNDELLMDVNLLPNGNGVRRTFMLTHVYGRRCNMEAVQAWKDNWPSSPTTVVEDMAELHGVKPHPGTDAACWSFYRNKIVAGEEGGAVAFKDRGAAGRARELRTLGFTEAHDYMHRPRGHNYRLSNLHANAIRHSLRYFPRNLERRRHMEAMYDAACPAEWRQPPRQSPWVYDVRIPGLTLEKQAKIVARLNEAGIAARQGFKPMTWQQEYQGPTGPQADRAAREVFYLPLTPSVDVRRAFELVQVECQ